MSALLAPFPWFGGKRAVVDLVWERFGRVTHYVEPFCGSAAMLLGAPHPASLEVVNDQNGFIANFWRAVKHQPEEVAHEADYPVSHVDKSARHVWLLKRRNDLSQKLQDPLWPGCARVAGWWLWGQCAHIGTGWCDWQKSESDKSGIINIPYLSSPGQGIHASEAIPEIGIPGRGILTLNEDLHPLPSDSPEFLTSAGCKAWSWLRALSRRLERVRILHGDWTRCLNDNYGGPESTAFFLDPPYKGYEKLYPGCCAPVAVAVEEWARRHSVSPVAICGHLGDYDLPGWTIESWSRPGATFGGTKTKDAEAIWFSPACRAGAQGKLFSVPTNGTPANDVAPSATATAPTLREDLPPPSPPLPPPLPPPPPPQVGKKRTETSTQQLPLWSK